MAMPFLGQSMPQMQMDTSQMQLSAQLQAIQQQMLLNQLYQQQQALLHSQQHNPYFLQAPQLQQPAMHPSYPQMNPLQLQ
jgi:hypothetical protein